MLPESVQDRAALFVAGGMTPDERDSFEVVLEYHDELRAHVSRLQGAVAVVEASVAPGAGRPPPAGLRSRILDAVNSLPPPPPPDALVVTDAGGRVEWVNRAFSAMCGYELSEIKGRKPGEFLQGAETEAEAVRRIREAMRRRQPCREALLNYHKDGSTYQVDLRISPVLDDAGEPLYFVARERKMSGSADAGA